MYAEVLATPYYRPLSWVLKFDPGQPRDKDGQWVKVGGQIAAFKAKYPAVAKQYPKSTYTEMGSIEAHTTDVGREWEKQLSHEQLAGISERFGSDVDRLMSSAIALHDIGKAEAIEEGAGKHAQHEHTIPIMQGVLHAEGFTEKEVSLVTELLNHDLIGPLFRGNEGFKAKEATVIAGLQAKADKVGMNLSDFVTLQLAFYQADASAYPYITQFMTQEPSGKWTFTGKPQIAGIEALVRKFDPAQPRDEEGQWTRGGAGGFDPANKKTWAKTGGEWHTGADGEAPYGWSKRQDHLNYQVPAVTHKVPRFENFGWWGASHSGSRTITGESASIMGIEGYDTDDRQEPESTAVAQRMLEEIAASPGSEEPLFHAFQNTAHTRFAAGDTMDLPLMASAGEPNTGYATRTYVEDQQGPPTVFVFPPGTKMMAYDKWPTNPKDRGYEDGNAQEFGHVYSEAIVAGRFRVVKVETQYFGSQHSHKPVEGQYPQLYGQVVHLEPIGFFNPATKQWEESHG